MNVLVCLTVPEHLLTRILEFYGARQLTDPGLMYEVNTFAQTVFPGNYSVIFLPDIGLRLSVLIENDSQLTWWAMHGAEVCKTASRIRKFHNTVGQYQ